MSNRILVGGCFDVIHIGHITFLEQAKKIGGKLVVALESDEHIRNKKNREPVHTQEERKKLLMALRAVDSVILLPPHPDYAALVNEVQPTHIALTEPDPQLENKTRLARSVGAQIISIPFVNSLSTTHILRHIAL